MTISQTLFQAAQQLKHLDDHTTIARLIIGHVLGLSQQQMWLEEKKGVTQQDQKEINRLIRRAANHEPLAYLLGSKDFYGRRFQVTPDTLIPRPETEQLVDMVLNSAQAQLPSPIIIDVGTGSGCLAITLALHLPQAHLYAIDISEKALSVARTNARQYQADNITFIEGDLLQPLSQLSVPIYADVIVANLPYISEHDYHHLPLNIKNYEPALALVSGPHADTINRQLISQANHYLKPDGFFAYETTNGQIIRVK